MFGLIILLTVLTVVVRVVWRGDSITRPMLWISSFAGSIVVGFFGTLIAAATLFPQVG